MKIDTCCDISSVALERAATKARRAGVSVEWQRRNILTDGLPAECDVVCCSLFLHHLSDAEALALLTALGESRVRLVLISDLVRSRWNYWLTWIGTRLLSRSHIVHFDGPVSIRAAFTPDEARQLAQQAGLVGARAISHWSARFLLCWKRPE